MGGRCPTFRPCNRTLVIGLGLPARSPIDVTRATAERPAVRRTSDGTSPPWRQDRHTTRHRRPQQARETPRRPRWNAGADVRQTSSFSPSSPDHGHRRGSPLTVDDGENDLRLTTMYQHGLKRKQPLMYAGRVPGRTTRRRTRWARFASYAAPSFLTGVLAHEGVPAALTSPLGGGSIGGCSFVLMLFYKGTACSRGR